MSRKEFEKYNTKYSLIKDWVFPFSEVTSGSKILLYGAGDVGQAYYEQLKHTNYCEVVYWVDKEYDKYNEYNLPVIGISEVDESKVDYAVIAVYSHEVAIEINRSLLEHGISQEKVIWIGNIRNTIRDTLINSRLIKPSIERVSTICKRRGISEKDAWAQGLIDKIKKSDIEGCCIIPRLVLQLTNICTMRCEGCNNLIPFARNPQHEMLEDILADIDRFLNEVDMIVTLELLGGEPFTYPWIAKVLDTLIRKEKILEIEITTNGTIIPNDEVLNRLTCGKLYVIISDYGHKNQKKLEDVFSSRGINYDVKNQNKWIDSGNTVLRNKSVDERRADYRKCESGIMCKTLYKGKIHKCPRAASLFEMGIINGESEVVDLRTSFSGKEAIKRFWLEQDCLACDHCDYAQIWREIDVPRV